MTSQTAEKERVARESVSLVEDGMTLGLGSGSTAAMMIRFLGERVQAGLKIRGVPTSTTSENIARECGVPLITLADCQELDLTIDGTDEVDDRCRLIKGGGGALLREKIVASVSRQLVIIADGSKQVDQLGHFPLPVEVIPFAVPVVSRAIQQLGTTPVLRTDAATGTAFKTDEGNAILDCPFQTITDPEALAAKLNAIPGIVEHGLFLNLATRVLIATGEDLQTLTPPAD